MALMLLPKEHRHNHHHKSLSKNLYKFCQAVDFTQKNDVALMQPSLTKALMVAMESGGWRSGMVKASGKEVPRAKASALFTVMDNLDSQHHSPWVEEALGESDTALDPMW